MLNDIRKILGGILLAAVLITAVVAQLRVNSGEFYSYPLAFAATANDAVQLFNPGAEIF